MTALCARAVENAVSFNHNALSTECVVATFALAWAVYHINLGFHILKTSKTI